MTPTHASTDSARAVGPLLVLAAMPEESAPVITRLESPTELRTPFIGGVSAVRGMLAGVESVVVTTGIGIAAATAAATWGILAHAPRAVVAAGSCGGLAADVEVGTLIVGDSFTYSIADATAFGYAPGQVPGGPERHLAPADWADRAEHAAGARAGEAGYRRGLMLSGDAFVTAPLADPLRAQFPGALSADMETTASARTAESLAVPFVALRAVSDLCGPAAGQQFHLEIDLVAEISAAAVEELARSLAG
ncbi:5'-methylthioadenosine/S-adenosylhomocysteine nucleosidase [Brachybacterium alimentarium]|uniref:5'-methylthioadenosine/S-adenosylhomocysteine nucleosidase n=1 Tax=Brachybacterium alimentarium TaxID=47845 RepID=UPI000DF466E4|nr:5'-methylthioadenosine/S-adenosylhomocysteine nucleosidase [Brachybacterium alimentarium]RCS67298.1 5'-methylthioadenosine/S-adenosylhomocysteine nucleosidase [Brachybacterium alimentarium]RCS71230.1 5'-methylthioadenosine/S-adenosylhomocysteine nucleosidase [Brachybacterium alimentarium]RCS84352.1 5'-methylthioadenosine/S-adenosylhomocysteine nucleosidase [Brachybacterium alimentarium]RCS93053.1 5'-methylthioadenosine/S-adenosylhomocysteine nucleosidase [Brachybacterium alimentarium]